MEINLKYNFSALKLMEKHGIEMENLQDGVSIEKIGIVFWAGLYGADKKITQEDSENLFDKLIEDMGMESGLEYVATKINEAMTEKK
jgi:hypothetical protein